MFESYSKAPEGFPKCPSCKTGRLEEAVPIGRRFAELAKEVLSRSRWWRAVSDRLILRQTTPRPGLQWRCESCKTRLLYCDNCEQVWFVDKKLDYLNRVTCPRCQTEYNNPVA
jgi:uncharacterized paraquat-inducible protein A